MLFTDKVRITTINNDIVFNADITGSVNDVKAYIENNTKVRYGSDGTPFTPRFLVFLESDVSIFLEDKIEILLIHGQAPVGDEAGEKDVAQIRRVGGFQISHLEVMI